VIPEVIQAQGPFPAKINNPAGDRANLIFIQTKIIQVNLNIGLPFPDIAEFTVCLVELGTAVKSKAFIQHVIGGFLIRPGTRKTEPANKYHANTYYFHTATLQSAKNLMGETSIEPF
jgi:hypothetical protein